MNTETTSLANIKRVRLINRILKHSDIYTLQDLKELSTNELVELQKTSLIQFRIRSIFNKRHKFYLN